MMKACALALLITAVAAAPARRLEDGGVWPVKKATQKKAAKAAKTMNDDATIVVSAPDIGNATSAGDDQDTTHESTAPASSTCKGNSDCPRGANGHLNRCIEGTCKD